MGAEFLFVVFFAIFLFLIIVYTPLVWAHVPEARGEIRRKTIYVGIDLAVVLCILAYTWFDGLDTTPLLGPITLQSALLFICALLCVVHLNEMQNIEDEAVANV